MSYNFYTKLAKKSNYGSKRAKSSIKYIVFHYTGNKTDTARANANYFANNAYLNASAHYFVDATDVYRSVPDDYVAWSVGSTGLLDQGSAYAKKGGKYFGKCTNANSISIEMCCTNGRHSEDTLKNAQALGKKLAKEYGIDKEHILRHFDVNGKLCPLTMVTDEAMWYDFRRGIFDSKYKALMDMNIREKADLDSKVVGILKEGKTITGTPYSKDKTWLKTSKGYIRIKGSKTYLKEV